SALVPYTTLCRSSDWWGYALSNLTRQRFDAILQARVRREQLSEAALAVTRDTERHQLRRHVGFLVHGLQAAQCVDHLLTSSQLCTTGIGAEFTLAREPHDDDGSENTQQDFQHDVNHERADTRAIFIFERDVVDKTAGCARDENH